MKDIVRPQNPMRILLVEDDEDHADLIKMVVRDHGVPNELEHVWDGEEAMAYLRREGAHANAWRPDIVLLDLKLPRMDGHEVLHAIKTDLDLLTIPVVMLTTSAAERDRGIAYRHYVNSYLVKPTDYTRLTELVGTLAEYWGNCNLPAPQG